MAIAPDHTFQLYTCRNSRLVRNLGWLQPFAEDLWNRLVVSCAEEGIEGRPKRIGVVGVYEGDGATTVAMGLAFYLAENLGLRVCVIETDLRSPSVQADGMAPSGSIGLKGYLSGECGIDEVIFHVDPLGVHVLPAGPGVTSPSALLDSKALASTLQAVERLFDVVIVNAPALNIAPEDRVILAATQANVLLLRSGRALPSQAAYWIGKLQEYGAKLGAICLNGVKFGLPSALRRLL